MQNSAVQHTTIIGFKHKIAQAIKRIRAPSLVNRAGTGGHVCMHSCMHNAYAHTYSMLHTYIRTYIHTHIQTCIHICRHIYIYISTDSPTCSNPEAAHKLVSSTLCSQLFCACEVSGTRIMTRTFTGFRFQGLG